MSAAVVPGAKLEATMVQGPALPLMLRPLGCCGRGALEESELIAWVRRLVRSRWDCVEALRLTGGRKGLRGEELEADDEERWD